MTDEEQQAQPEQPEPPKKRGRPRKEKPPERTYPPGAAIPRKFKFSEKTDTITHVFQAGVPYEIRMTDSEWETFKQNWKPKVL